MAGTSFELPPFVLPPTPWLRKRTLLISFLATLSVYGLGIAIAGQIIYGKHADTSFTRFVSSLITFPAAAANGTVISYERFAWEVRSRRYYAAAHNLPSTRAETEDFVLKQLINRSLYRKLLKKEGVVLDNAEVDRQLQSITTEVGGQAKLQAFLVENYGPSINVDKFRLWLADSLAEAAVQQKLLTQVKLQHIVVAIPDNADAATIEAGRKRAEDIKGKIDSAEKFAEIAREFSDDVASRDNAGEIGITIRGQTDPYGTDFEQAVFAAQVGDIVGPVRSKYGWHIVRVQSREGRIDSSLTDLTQGLRDKAKIRVYLKPKD